MVCLIRAATPTDAAGVFVLVEQFATSFKPEWETYETSFHQILADDAACLLVAEQENRIMGYCLGFDHATFYANGRVTWVEEIMVQAEFRRQRVGAALMAAMEAWATQRNSALVALATRRASAFYLALGYAESATYFRKLL